MAYTIYQKAGQRLNATAFNQALQTARFYEDYAVSARTAIDLDTKTGNRIMLPSNDHAEFLQLQVGIIRTNTSISADDEDRVTKDFEDNGSGFPEELDWTNMYTDGVSVGTITKTVDYFSKTAVVEEGGAYIKLDLRITATHYSFTVGGGEHIQLENAVYSGSRLYLSNVYFVSYNNQSTSYNPAYKGQTIGDIVDSVTDNLLNENTELFACVPIHKIENSSTESVFEIGQGVLSNTDVEDAFIFRFVAKDSTVYLYNAIDTPEISGAYASDFCRIVTTDGAVHQAPEYFIQLTPYKTVGTDYYYEFSIYKEDDENTATPLSLLFYFYTDTVAKTNADIRYAVYLQSMHYNRYRATPTSYNTQRCNYPTSYSSNSAIHQQLINDFINVTKRNYFTTPMSLFKTSVNRSSTADFYRVYLANPPYSVIASNELESPTVSINSRYVELFIN